MVGHATGTDLLKVPIPYIRPKFQGISLQNIVLYMVQYLHLLDPEIPIEQMIDT